MTGMSANAEGRRSPFGILVAVFAGVIVSQWFGSIAIPYNETAHFALETATVTLSFVVGLIAIRHYYLVFDILLLFIGVAFLGSGLLEGYHVLFSPEPLQNNNANYQPIIFWLWLPSPLFLGVMFVLGVLSDIYCQKQNRRFQVDDRSVYFVASLLVIIIFFTFLYTSQLNSIILRIQDTDVARLSPTFLFVMVLLLLIWQRKWRSEQLHYFLVLALIFFVVAEVSFYAVLPTESAPESHTAHLLKLSGIFCVLLALIASNAQHLNKLINEARVSNAIDEKLLVAERTRQELRQQLAVKEEHLSSLGVELETILQTVSDDLKAPLNRIKNFNAAISEDFEADISPDAKKYLKRIEIESARMDAIISDLAELSRASRQVMNPQRIDLTRLARDIVNDLRERDPDRELKLDIQAGLTCYGDLKLMRSALGNIIDNAWKYSKPKPTTSIEVGSSLVDNERVYFVRDKGVGFDMNFVEQLFEAFKKLHADSEFDGKGVGLATVARIIKRHGGQVWADSKIGQGSTFYFTIGDRSHSL